MSSPLIPWAGMDPGEVDDTACGHIKHKNVGCASCTARETEDDSIADEEDTDDEDIAEVDLDVVACLIVFPCVPPRPLVRGIAR